MKGFVDSYRDLPIYAYQFQTKFRNELRSKAGLMRGREFIMKDLYDFSRDEQQHKEFYETMKGVYTRIFERLGLGEQTFMTISNGYPFSKYSYEFQTMCPAGEDIIVYDREKGISINKDDFNDETLADFGVNADECNFEEAVTSEVGDIYSLGEKYAKAIGLTYKDENGEEQVVYMGSYGIGVPRVMGVMVENFSDDKGIMWPAQVAPFQVHLVSFGDNSDVWDMAEATYNKLNEMGIEVIFDDRRTAGPGQKFSDADLMGMPWRMVVSSRSLEAGGIELSARSGGESRIVGIDEISMHLLDSQ